MPGAIFLPENQTHSGNNQTDSLETTIAGVVELAGTKWPQLRYNVGWKRPQWNGLIFPTAADVIDEVYTRRKSKITDQEAGEMLQSSENVFGDENKFAKFRLRQTKIRYGDRNNDAFTSALRQAGLSEGAQYEGKVKNSVYAVCQGEPATTSRWNFHAWERTAQGDRGREPELTAVVEAAIQLH